jgi:cytochrome c oxidase subunit III
LFGALEILFFQKIGFLTFYNPKILFFEKIGFSLYNSKMQNNASGNPSQDDAQFLFHPKNVMLMILLAGLCFLFLALTISYVYTRVTMNVAPVKLPWLFLVNTLILLSSSYTMIIAKRNYKDDDTQGYILNLRRTMQLSFLFMVMQAVAWVWLIQNNINLKSSTTTGYLYVISFVHLAHVVAGLPWLYTFYKAAKKTMIDPVTVLVYFSDPERRLKLRLLTIYWHFLDILWVYLVVFFAINYFI